VRERERVCGEVSQVRVCERAFAPGFFLLPLPQPPTSRPVQHLTRRDLARRGPRAFYLTSTRARARARIRRLSPPIAAAAAAAAVFRFRRAARQHQPLPRGASSHALARADARAREIAYRLWKTRRVRLDSAAPRVVCRYDSYNADQLPIALAARRRE